MGCQSVWGLATSLNLQGQEVMTQVVSWGPRSNSANYPRVPLGKRLLSSEPWSVGPSEKQV